MFCLVCLHTVSYIDIENIDTVRNMYRNKGKSSTSFLITTGIFILRQVLLIHC